MKLPIHLLPLRIQMWRQDHPKIVTTYHDLRVPYLFPKAGRLRWWAVLALARWSDAVIVTNADDKARLQSFDFVDQIAQIPIGSNIAPNAPENYERDAWRARWDVGSDDILLAYFGFLNESKGAETLIRTVARLAHEGQPIKLLMVGGKVGSSDPSNLAYVERIDQLIDMLGIADHVLSTGYIPATEVSANLLAADICVLPYRDGVSLRRGTFMAAIAHGLPVVSTRYPVAKKHIPNPAERWHPAELKGGSNILLVPPDDEEVLADAIARLIASPRLRQHLGEEAKALSARFSWPQIAQQTLELFREIDVVEQD
jgi:glycosyltransferase involved in cell wall biosynthesis